MHSANYADGLLHAGTVSTVETAKHRPIIRLFHSNQFFTNVNLELNKVSLYQKYSN